MLVDADTILRGAYLAVEQSGLLLQDACLLYQDRRWASSLMLAVFSREEFGKAEKLLKDAIGAAAHGPIEEEKLTSGLRVHEKKLQLGWGPATRVVADWSWTDPDYPSDAQEAEDAQRLAEAQKAAREEGPRQDHETRKRALFVDFDSGRWHSPVEITHIDAYEMILKVAIDYDLRRSMFIRPTEPYVARAFKLLKNKLPTLSAAQYPNEPPPIEP